MAATAAHLEIRTQPTKPKRRCCRETTDSATATTVISSSASFLSRKLDPPTVVAAADNWCCPASKPAPPSPSLLPPRQDSEHVSAVANVNSSTFPSLSMSLFPSPFSSDPPQSSSSLKIRYPQPMDSIPVTAPTPTVYGAVNGWTIGSQDAFPSSFSKFNSALTAGLLNPMSPPPSADKIRSSPTLFEMMASEPDCQPRASQIPTSNVSVSIPRPQIPQQEKQALMQQRLSNLLACRSPDNQFNDPISSDVKLALSSKDGLSVSMSVHRQILAAHSRFFAVKLSSDHWSKHHKSSSPYIVEISDCHDIEVYVETLRLMYCKDLRKKLMKEDVSRVLGILKVSAAIGFDAGVLSCLEFLEAAPWAEDEEEKVASLLSELRLEGAGAGEVLKRVSVDVTTTGGVEGGNENEEVLLKLIHVVLEGKDEKARREMKGLVSKMLRENASQSALRKESLYCACDECLRLLRRHFLRAAEADLLDASQIARQADNLHWILDILIDRQMAEDFLKTWASQSELSDAHSRVPAIHRYEISGVTARLFVGIGKGQLLASKDARCLLLQTWLVPFYEDFGWMRRASKGLDRHLIEDGLSNTILTLPLSLQQEILMSWFDRFLNSGDDCPNIQRGFEVWWRRAFWRRKGEPERFLQRK